MNSVTITDLNAPENEEIRNYPGYNTGKSMTARLKKGDYSGLRYDHVFTDADVEKVIAYALTQLTDLRMKDVEEKEATKIGPFNRDPYEHWSEKVEAYYAPTNWNPNNEALRVAKFKLLSEIAGQTDGKLTPISLDEAVVRSTHNKNLGMPYGVSKWKEGDVYLPHITDYVYRANDLIEGKTQQIAVSILGHRSQPGANGTIKNRPMMMSDHSETFAALTLQRVLMPVLQKVPAFCGFLKHEDMVEAMEPLYTETVHGISYGDDAVMTVHGKFYSLDFEQFDATCKHNLMKIVLIDVLLPLFTEEQRPLLEALLEIYTHQALWTPDGVIRGEHGLFSGVALTSIIGTLINRLFFLYMESCGVLNEHLTPEMIEEKAWELGLKMNASKQVISTEYFDFCQKRYFPDRKGGTYSIMRTLGRCIYQEGWIDAQEVAQKSNVSVDDFDITSLLMLRIIVKLENCLHSPDHEWLVKFVRANEDHNLDTRLIFGASQFMTEVRSRMDRASGLHNFETIAIIQWEEELELREPKNEKHARALRKKTELELRAFERAQERKAHALAAEETAKTEKALRKAANIAKNEKAFRDKALKKAAIAASLKAEAEERAARKEANRRANAPKEKKVSVPKVRTGEFVEVELKKP